MILKKCKDDIKYIDLFSGIGGFRYSLDKIGCKCVFSAEIDKNCCEVYKKNYGEYPLVDIRKIHEDDIPDFDILCAGFPCQPFSICGKKLGFEDIRGTLFFDICRIIAKKQPKVLFLENVKNIVTHDKGRTFKTIINMLQKLGYNTSCKVLNSKDFGVAQSRERVIIIGTKYGKFNFSTLNKHKPVYIKNVLDVSGDFLYLDENEYTLIDKRYIHRQPSGLIFVGYRNKATWKKGVKPHTEHLSRVHRQPNRIYSAEGIHPTIPSQESSGRFWIYLENEKRVRKLTITECYRLMGFPDNFKRDKSIGKAYNQIGNSVVIPMIIDIAKEIILQGFLGGKNGQFREDFTQLTFDI